MEEETLPITLDQVVAYNLRRARQQRSWTQAEAAEQLEPFLGERWSSAVFSAAERSYESSRIREFTASHVLAFSRGFDLPIPWFFEPPAPSTRVTSRGSSQSISGEDLVKLLEYRPGQQEPGEAVKKLMQDLVQGKVPLGDAGHPLIPEHVALWRAVGLIPAGVAEDILRFYLANASRDDSATWKGPDSTPEEEE